MCQFRTLRADEIDVRAQQVSEYGDVTLLLYKDARVDMSLLDEEFGIFGWQREHSFKDGLNYCKVSVRNKETGEWVVKEDVGTESNTEAEKGAASDAFKRACVNLGIGRELYTAPHIKVELTEKETYKSGSSTRLSKFVSFYVAYIDYDEHRRISALKIADNNGRIRYEYQHGKKAASTKVAEETKPQQKAEEKPKQKTTLTHMHITNLAMLNQLIEWFVKNDYSKRTSDEYDAAEAIKKYYVIEDADAQIFATKFNAHIGRA